MDKFLQILADLQLASSAVVASGIPSAQIPAELAGTLISIAQTAIKAHQDIIGQPLDLDLLKPIDKV